MNNLHIIQAGIENGDKQWLERAARQGLNARTWIAPKTVSIGDEAVIYIRGYGFFATARIDSQAHLRKDWPNRYGARLKSIKLIKPAISLIVIRHSIPKLKWAIYPRSITTASLETAAQVRELIRARCTTKIPILDEELLPEANLDELRKAALARASRTAKRKVRMVIERVRARAIRLYVLRRANGKCEGCNTAAPFRTIEGQFYLEPHHVDRLADDGPDHPAKVIGLCPNCHRRAHHAIDAKAFNKTLKKRLISLERRNR